MKPERKEKAPLDNLSALSSRKNYFSLKTIINIEPETIAIFLSSRGSRSSLNGINDIVSKNQLNLVGKPINKSQLMAIKIAASCFISGAPAHPVIL
tara:strand:+ start:452 stop:739 length:288 start_codon:yes stop_codon:yes gene_type:complete